MNPLWWRAVLLRSDDYGWLVPMVSMLRKVLARTPSPTYVLFDVVRYWITKSITREGIAGLAG